MQPRRHGFTLLELLVAMTVTLMLTGLLLAVLSTTLGLWQRLRGGIDQTTQGRLALDWLERDLQGALHRADGNTWMAVDILNSPAALAGHGWLVQPMMKPGGADSLRMIPPGPTATIADARFGLSGCWVRWVSQNLEPVGTASAPVVVSYQLVRRPITGAIASSNSAAVRYRLYRTAVTPAQTFASGYHVRGSAYQPAAAAPGAERSLSAVISPNSAEALAENVVDFGVWFYARNSNGTLLRIFPADAAGLAYSATAGSFPAVADVMLRILDEAGAAELAAIESGLIIRPPQHGTDAAWWWAVVETHSRVFVRRVELKGGRL